MTAFQTFARTAVILICVFVGNRVCTATHALAPGKETEVEELITQLNAGRFKIREQATSQLANLGVVALKPLAIHFLDASPEAAWRIKRILESISVKSTEELASLKAIGILMLLDHKVDEKLAGLVHTWRENRSQRAIEFLVGKGAQMTPTGVPRQLIVQRPKIPVQTFKSGSSNPLRAKARKRLPPEKLRAEIDKVVSGNFDEVQRYVLNQLPSLNDSSGQLVDDPFVVNAVMGGMGANRTSSTFIEFGETWKGTGEDFEKLKDIHSLTAVRFKGQRLRSRELDLLSELKGLQHIGFSDTKIASGKLTDLSIPKGITSVELEDYKFDDDTIDWLTSHPIYALTLNRCQLSKAAVKSFDDLSSLQTIDVRRTKLNADVFDKWLGMSEVKRIYLSVCKFNPQSYRDFNKIRRNVIVFNPVSFLGVQGVRDTRLRDQYSCEIEMVVAGSGADKAGIQAGDLITHVNDDGIQSFEELRMFISQFDIGELMKLTVVRDSKTIELFAELGTNTNRPLR